MANGYARYSSLGGGGGGSSGVTSLNALTGAVVLAAGSNITLTPAGNTITIATTGTAGTPFQETPIGAINNSNVTFTVSSTPLTASAFVLYLDGLVLVQGVDYTLAGATITMTTAPNFAETLYAAYTVSSGGGTVTSVNGQSGALNFLAGAGLSVSTVGSNITYTALATNPLTVFGARAAPLNITAGGGISFSGSTALNKAYIQGSGGAVVVTANPQIAAGTVDGQQLVLQGCSAPNTVELQDGNGLVLNGAWFAGLYNSITLTWDLVAWVEMSRQ